jgi:isoquinoline 1-oxidoreductase beta subunit
MYDRRSFLAASLTGAAGVVFAVRFGEAAVLNRLDAPARAALEPHLWIRLSSDGEVLLRFTKTEMGQGVLTALPMLIAEELDADWTRVRVEHTPIEARYGDFDTGGSDSVRSSFLPARQAGAAVRALLVAAAAAEWGAPATECETSAGVVVHRPTGRRLPYGRLVERAATLPVPALDSVPLKDHIRFRIAGTATRRLDTRAKINGSAVFGTDVRLPGMLFASVLPSPVFGGQFKRVNDAAALAVPGVQKVLVLTPFAERTRLPSRVAVLATSTWAALKGRRALEVEWDDGPAAAFSSAQFSNECHDALGRDGMLVTQRGDIQAARTRAAKTVEAIYEVPLLAHACMEPMNATADVRGDRAEIWAPAQSPMRIANEAARRLGIPPANVTMHVTLAGGGFGRRFYADFGVEAAELSRAAGAPVQVVWTREDDIHRDVYRPHRVARLRAHLDERGIPIGWDTRLVGAAWRAYWDPTTDRPWTSDVGGVAPFYSVPSVFVDFVPLKAPMPLGAWRAVSNGENTFFIETFLDEIAAETRQDPLALRLRLVEGRDRLAHVLRIAAQRAGWGNQRPKGYGQGLACCDYDGTYVAQIADVVAQPDGSARVTRIVCAFDCGQMVNPDTVRAQIEGSIGWATSATLHGEITVTAGRVDQQNFNDYQVLRLSEMPRVEIVLVENHEKPTGVGEPAVTPVAPAIVNAIYAATGKRVRRLPLQHRA